MFEPIARFMQVGGQEVPSEPDWYPNPLEIDKFIMRAEEELDELGEAVFGGSEDLTAAEYGETFCVDVPEAVDAWLDLAYVAFTGALSIAGLEKTQAAWDAIVDANLAKIDGRHGDVVVNEETGKIGKPKGWTAPDIEEILNG